MFFKWNVFFQKQAEKLILSRSICFQIPFFKLHFNPIVYFPFSAGKLKLLFAAKSGLASFRKCFHCASINSIQLNRAENALVLLLFLVSLLLRREEVRFSRKNYTSENYWKYFLNFWVDYKQENPKAKFQAGRKYFV